MGGVNPINYQEIYSYCKLHHIEPEEWELLLLRKFDRVVIDMHAKQQEAENLKQQSKAK